MQALDRLERVELGSMKGLRSIEELADASALTELLLIGKVPLAQKDIDLLVAHLTLRAFDWFWEDVPDRLAKPVVERMAHLPRPEALDAGAWFDNRDQ
jgi:hypothetical protein